MAVLHQNMRRRPRRFATPSSLLVLPLLVIALAFIWPVALLMAESFRDGNSGLSNYLSFFGSAGLRQILWRTIWISALVSAICVVLGYPVAYLAATSNSTARMAILGVVSVSMFISLVVRCYAWLAILDRSGLINSTLNYLGLSSLTFVGVHNLAGVLIGVTQFTLPFMVLAIYDILRRIDPRLMTAAQSLGASPARSFYTIFLPLSLPGIISGITIVFITSLGYYIAPSILGGPQNMMMGEVLATSIRTTGDWAQGATISTVMLVLALGFYVMLQTWSNRVGMAK